MFSWLFKKKTQAPAATAPAQVAAQVAQAAAQAKQAQQAQQKAAAAEWAARIDRAVGDDPALLALAKDAPSVDLKLTAVRALTTEATLKLAEREFRTHDRRVHQLAKQLHAAARLQRETSERVAELITLAQSLRQQTEIPVNRLAELDRHWQALDPSLIQPAQQTEFKALTASLTAQLQAQTEHQAAVKRRTAQARQVMTQLETPAAPIKPVETTEPVAITETPALEETAAANAPAPAKERAPRIAKAPTAQEKAAIETHLSQAETALADGQLAQVQQHLQALDALGPMDAAQRSRLGALHAETARLKGWQHWGGGLARDELLLEAEALAKATADAAETGEPIPQIQAHAQTIDELRQRWRALDRLKAAGNQSAWERFDAALQAAYVPVAAHLAQLEAERQTNLASRQALLDTLEATPLPQGDGDWKDVIRALDQFQGAWRKLGPAQHTTPRKAQKTLFQRLDAALARLEAPLAQARSIAQAEREALVARAQSIDPSSRGGEAVAQVRELQAQWQQHARSLPLHRAKETALWADFKAATDAIFAQREAAFKARDAAIDANEAERIALIERLESLNTDTLVADIKRTLAEADAAWRQAGESSRANAAALDARWRAARANAQTLVTRHAQRVWQGTCDTLLNKLALCEAQEANADASVDVDSQWAALPALPAVWEQALIQRKNAAQAGAAAPSSKDSTTADAALLQLEAMLDLPSPADQSEARRELKLLTMKATLEGRPLPGSSGVANKAADQLTAEVLGQAHLHEAQRQRLHQLIAGLRAQPPHQAFSAALRSK